MFIITYLSKKENSITIPAVLHDKWGLDGIEHLYASIRTNHVIFTKHAHSNSTQTNLTRAKRIKHQPHSNSNICDKMFYLDAHFITQLKISPGDEVLLALDNDELTLHKSDVAQVQSQKKALLDLEEKLTKEYEDIKARQIGTDPCWLLDDIYMFLLLNSWDEATLNALFSNPNTIKELLADFRNDNEVNEFLNKKLLEIVERQID